MKEYVGPLCIRKMTWAAGKAYASWLQQRHRCNYKKHPSYKYYGAKGVSVKYSSREFVAWWVKTVGNSKAIVVCDRIDPSGDYEFGNIQLISKSENSRKVYRDNPKIRIVPVIWHSPFGNIRYESVKEASNEIGIGITCIWKHCNGLIENKKFSYAGKTKTWRKKK